MLDLDVTSRLKFYAKEAKNAILDDQTDRVKAAANFMRRTVRKAVGQLGPSVTVSTKVIGPDGKERKTVLARTFTAGSEPGDPPYRRSGWTYSSVGYDITKKTSSWTASATISIDAHGWETGQARSKPGVKRPALGPIFEANQPVIGAILSGEIPAPQHGDLGRAAHRKPTRTSETYVVASGQMRTKTTLGYGRR